MQTQNHLRYKKRVPCEFRDDDGNHIGMALNVSESGLFVSSRTTPSVGSRVLVNLSPQHGPAAEGIPARVVWKRKVHRSANSLADGGIGLEIEGASEVYTRFIEGLLPKVAAQRWVAQPEVAAPVADEAPLLAYRVRVALIGSPRTRYVEVQAKDAQAAASEALETLGEGWQTIEIEEAGPPLDPEDQRF